MWEYPHFLVGTPEHLREMISQQHLSLDDLKTFVLDNSQAGNELFNGYSELIAELMEMLPSNAQVSVFSHTALTGIATDLKLKICDPRSILMQHDQVTLEGIRQFYVGVTQEEWKFETLLDLYEVEAIRTRQAIIFINALCKVDVLAKKLADAGMHAFRSCVQVLHPGMPQSDHDIVIWEFRTGNCRLLIFTGVPIRGIAHVLQPYFTIFYDLPFIETYLHQVGRAGKFGRKGVVINFLTDYVDSCKLKNIEKYYCTQVEELSMNVGDLI